MTSAALCPHRPPCPGCPRFGANELDPVALARLAALASEHGAPLDVVAGEGFGSRHRVRLSARATPEGIALGLFEERSHRLVAIPECPLHHPSIEAVLAELVPLLRARRIEPYDEVAHRGVLRAVQLAVERPTGLVQVVFVVRDRLGPGSFAVKQLEPVARALVDARRADGGALVQGIFWNAQPDKTNTLVGERFEKFWGEDVLADTSGGARVFYPPGAFGQANPVLHDEAIRRIHAEVPHGARVVEFHAGVGSIGLGLARTNPLVLNEIGPGSLAGLALGIAALDDASRVRVVPGPADEHAREIERADVVVVDPPRKGLSSLLLEQLAANPPAKLLYLSCGLDSFLRDVAALGGALRLRRSTALGYFPFTEHVETLGVFERSRV